MNLAYLIEEKLKQLPRNATLIEGEAKGVDSIARDFWINQKRRYLEPYWADWAEHGNAAGVIRNQRMLDEGKPDLVICFFTNWATSRGTRDMWNRAKKAGVRVVAYQLEGDKLEVL